jgi:predicted Rdx family selenoprotein
LCQKDALYIRQQCNLLKTGWLEEETATMLKIALGCLNLHPTLKAFGNKLYDQVNSSASTEKKESLGYPQYKED